MIRNNHSKVSQKDSLQSYKVHARGRSSSAKSNPTSTHKKYKHLQHSQREHEKVLTQTTSSKIRRSQQQSPVKSISSGKKNKMHHMLSDKISTKSMRKGRLGKEKTFMMQSLNIPHIEPLAQE